MNDIIIIGAGPAGMTAAIYTVRKGYGVLVISKDVGGQTLWSSGVENYPGFRLISGLELMHKFEEHMESFPVKQIFAEVTGIESEAEGFSVHTGDGQVYQGRAIIIATGKSPRMLGVPGEEQFKGRGVAYCAICDAPLFAGLPVAVIGAGNSGLQAALQLLRICPQVTLVESSSRVAGDKVYVDRLQSEGGDRFRLMLDTGVVRIDGDTMVRSITVEGQEGRKALDVNGVFVEVGWTPSSGFAGEMLNLTSRGEILVDCFGHTSRPGILAAGDVTEVPKQIIIAAGEGAKAALAANDYLLRLEAMPPLRVNQDTGLDPR